MTFSEFLAWEQTQERRHEFVDGVAKPIAFRTRAQDRIQRNLLIRAAERLAGSGCEPLGSNMLVQAGIGSARYPDMTIDCGPYDPAAFIVTVPSVVFEILPDLSAALSFDWKVKFSDYEKTPSIRAYVMIAETDIQVFAYTRGSARRFSELPRRLRQLSDVLELPDVGLSMTLAEIYEGVGHGLSSGRTGDTKA